MQDKIADLVRARDFDQYVGQTTIKAHLDIKIQAARAQERLLESMLFAAPPGTGKTNLAQIVAQRIGDEMMYLPMPMSVEDFMFAVQMFMGGIVILDELHNAKPEFQEKLQFAIHDGYMAGKDGWTVDTRKCTFIGITTKALRDRLLPALQQRFIYQPTWEAYTDEEMAQIVAGMAERAGADIPPEVCVGLARSAGGTPRIVQTLVLAARDLTAIGRPITVEAVLDLAGFDCDGLRPPHLEYLRVLAAVGGKAGLPLLKSLLQANDQSVLDLERVLVLRGLIQRGSTGRRMMPPGYAKINQTEVGPSDPIARRRPISA